MGVTRKYNSKKMSADNETHEHVILLSTYIKADNNYSLLQGGKNYIHIYGYIKYTYNIHIILKWIWQCGNIEFKAF